MSDDQSPPLSLGKDPAGSDPTQPPTQPPTRPLTPPGPVPDFAPPSTEETSPYPAWGSAPTPPGPPTPAVPQQLAAPEPQPYQPPASGYAPFQPGASPYAAAPPGAGAYGAYGAPPVYGYGQSHGGATTAMVLGIVGIAVDIALLCCYGVGAIVGVGLGIAALVLGLKARREIDAQPHLYTNRSAAVAGIGTGIAAIAVGAISVIGWAVLVAFAFSGSSY